MLLLSSTLIPPLPKAEEANKRSLAYQQSTHDWRLPKQGINAAVKKINPIGWSRCASQEKTTNT